MSHITHYYRTCWRYNFIKKKKKEELCFLHLPPHYINSCKSTPISKIVSRFFISISTISYLTELKFEIKITRSQFFLLFFCYQKENYNFILSVFEIFNGNWYRTCSSLIWQFFVVKFFGLKLHLVSFFYMEWRTRLRVDFQIYWIRLGRKWFIVFGCITFRFVFVTVINISSTCNSF